MIIESDKKKGNLIAVVLLVIGLIFLFLTAKVEEPDRNQRAAFFLGLLLSSISGLALINQDERKTEIQSDTKRVIFKRKSFFTGEEIRVVPFDQIQKVGVTGVGRRGPVDSRSYFIYITVRNGNTIRTGYSSFDEYGTKELAAEMANLIGCEHSPTPIAPMDSELIENAIFAAIIAAVTWAFFYRYKVGPWCAAMWFGTGPALFMLTVFWAAYYLLLLLRRKYKY
tara:strand:- start:1662 stop:2336 length:675 start_codon:yes stop_codon:yes gene_type:complete